jgi:hypothetical protein
MGYRSVGQVVLKNSEKFRTGLLACFFKDEFVPYPLGQGGLQLTYIRCNANDYI